MSTPPLSVTTIETTDVVVHHKENTTLTYIVDVHHFSRCIIIGGAPLLKVHYYSRCKLRMSKRDLDEDHVALLTFSLACITLKGNAAPMHVAEATLLLLTLF